MPTSLLRRPTLLHAVAVAVTCSWSVAHAQATATPPRAAPPLAAAPSGLRVAGLQAPVSLTRDSAGIVHIDAKNEHDLFFAQGYSSARDRLFQLELWRRQATGTMAEALGPRWVARDRAARLLRYRGSMTTELVQYHPRGAAIIQAFVDGVNAYVDQVKRDTSLMPPDLKALGITPGKWTPAIVVSRHNALASNAKDEPNHARAVRAIGEAAVRRRKRFEPENARLAIDSAVAQLVGAANDAQLFADYDGSRSTPSFRLEEVASSWRRTGAALAPRDSDMERWESNNWVIAGSRTASGKPIVANDPHRTIAIPSLRYMVHLKAPGWDVIGGGEPAIPGVAIGHNQHGAWGLTIFGVDAEDLYVYELGASNPREYRYGGSFERMRIVTDTIRVRGAAPEIVKLAFTRHGPVLYTDSTRRQAVALRAAWLEPGSAPYLASLRLNQARNWSEARTALSYARMPALNWIWADTSGAIGWQTAAIAPIRPNWDGLVPVPGDGRFEWKGYLPILQMPHEASPTRGYVGTANAFNVPSSYGHFDALARTWADPYRRDRLLEVLDTTRKATVASSGALQHDEMSLPARALVPLLANITFSTPAASAAHDTVLRWNRFMSVDARGAALYAMWERRLSSITADVVVPRVARAAIRTVPLARTVEWLTRPDSLLGTRPAATRDSILRVAFEDAVADVTRRFGADMSTWRYGDPKFHYSRISHVLDALVHDSVRARLSPGPLPRGGYANTLHSTGNTDNQMHGASLRVVIDLANWDAARVTNTPGQSGDPRSPFYANLFPLWARGSFVPLPYSPAAIKARTAEVVLLSPQQ
ncbi:MAG TPA: penicillin acylase family protein [Gemmatimonas sp.]|uniref:penicillin acylase family protein n=1 Tax=Gemmatimonas sp. TaxID=1962908 RepID=UPI002EDB0C77